MNKEELDILDELAVDFMGEDRPSLIQYGPMSVDNKKVPFIAHWKNKDDEYIQRPNDAPNYINYSETGSIVSFSWCKIGEKAAKLHRMNGPAFCFCLQPMTSVEQNMGHHYYYYYNEREIGDEIAKFLESQDYVFSRSKPLEPDILTLFFLNRKQ